MRVLILALTLLIPLGSWAQCDPCVNWHVVTCLVNPANTSGRYQYSVNNGTCVLEWVDKVEYATEALCKQDWRFDPIYATILFRLMDPSIRGTAVPPTANRRVICHNFGP